MGVRLVVILCTITACFWVLHNHGRKFFGHVIGGQARDGICYMSYVVVVGQPAYVASMHCRQRWFEGGKLMI